MHSVNMTFKVLSAAKFTNSSSGKPKAIPKELPTIRLLDAGVLNSGSTSRSSNTPDLNEPSDQWLHGRIEGQAFLEGRAYVVPQDVKTLAPDVLRHRVVLSYEAEAENVTSDSIIARILDELKTP